MKLNAAKFYTSLFVIVLLFQMYLPSFKGNIFFQIFIIGIYFFLERVFVSKAFLKIILPLAILFCIGFIGTLVYKHNWYNVIKDIFHSIKPILGITIGYIFFKKINDTKLFIKVLIVAAGISAVMHFGVLILSGNLFTGSLNSIREFNKDNFLELFALFFLGYYKKFMKEDLYQSKTIFRLLFFFILASSILYFSRTMIVGAGVLAITIYGYTAITVKSLKIVGIAILSISLIYVYLFSIKIDRNQEGFQAFLYKIKNAPGEIFEFKIDRENHAQLWDHWRGYEASRAFHLMSQNPASYIIGSGHGSLVNLKFYAPLTGEKKGMKYISELHNGYAYVFYKTGIIGIILYLSFLFGLYKSIQGNKNLYNTFISAIGLFFFFTTLTITGIYNAGDIVIFILGGLIALSEANRLRVNNQTFNAIINE